VTGAKRSHRNQHRMAWRAGGLSILNSHPKQWRVATQRRSHRTPRTGVQFVGSSGTGRNGKAAPDGGTREASLKPGEVRYRRSNGRRPGSMNARRGASPARRGDAGTRPCSARRATVRVVLSDELMKENKVAEHRPGSPPSGRRPLGSSRPACPDRQIAACPSFRRGRACSLSWPTIITPRMSTQREALLKPRMDKAPSSITCSRSYRAFSRGWALCLA